MSHQLELYRQNAEAARKEAESADLPNVRARALEASSRWADMARRLERSEARGRIREDAIVKRVPNVE